MSSLEKPCVLFLCFFWQVRKSAFVFSARCVGPLEGKPPRYHQDEKARSFNPPSACPLDDPRPPPPQRRCALLPCASCGSAAVRRPFELPEKSGAMHCGPDAGASRASETSIRTRERTAHARQAHARQALGARSEEAPRSPRSSTNRSGGAP